MESLNELDQLKVRLYIIKAENLVAQIDTVDI